MRQTPGDNDATRGSLEGTQTMSDPKHPIWLLLGFLVVGGLGLGYCSLMYQNGADPLKDGALVSIVSGLAIAVGRFTGGSKS